MTQEEIQKELQERPEIMELVKVALDLPESVRGKAIEEAAEVLNEAKRKQDFYRGLVSRFLECFENLSKTGGMYEEEDAKEIISALQEIEPSIESGGLVVKLCFSFMKGYQAGCEDISNAE